MKRDPAPSRSSPERPGPARDDLADLAERILGVAREIGFQAALEHEPLRLTTTEVHVLRWIHRHPGSPAKDAAQATGLQRSNFSVALRALRGQGLVEALPDGVDGRSLRLHATELAEASLARHRARWSALLASALPADADLGPCLAVLAHLEATIPGVRSKDGRAVRGR